MKKGIIFLAALILGFSTSINAQKFVHPGINQTPDDLAYMKKQVIAGEQPWKDAFDQLKSRTDLETIIKPYAHVKRGPYARPNIGKAHRRFDRPLSVQRRGNPEIHKIWLAAKGC